MANDIGDIYIHYIFEPKYTRLKGKPQTWSTFTNEIDRLEDKIRHQRLLSTLKHELSVNVDPAETQLTKVYDLIQNQFKVDIHYLRSLKRHRVVMVDNQRQTVDEQKKLYKV
jgi:hypothetical protein